MTELFFEGAEPSLDDVPLQELLGRFPAGSYRLVGRTVDGRRIVGTARLTHAIPAGPGNVQAALDGSSLIISWDAVTGPPEGFPDEPIVIAGYQVIVGSFQVTVPATTLSVTVSPEFVASSPRASMSSRCWPSKRAETRRSPRRPSRSRDPSRCTMEAAMRTRRY